MSLTRPSLRRLLLASIAAGTVAGLGLFGLQHWTVTPLIERAEGYEQSASLGEAGHSHEAGHSADAEWTPADGLERTIYTALGTVLTGIAFAAILLGTASALGYALDLRRGVLIGIAGFVCFVLAPGIGLPPTPPGVPSADLQGAQIWWGAAAIASAAAIGLMFHPRSSWVARGAGLVVLVLPHAIGAPQQPTSTVVPIQLVREFAWLSVLTRLPFWLVLGALGGYLMADPLAHRAPAATTRV